jgi:ribonuclease G
MPSKLIINSFIWERRVALTENGLPVEFYVEKCSEKGFMGNIYKGKVVRVLPGMQAAFVEIGLERTAFLYVGDVYDHLVEFESMMTGGDDDDALQVRNQQYFSYMHLPFSIEDLLHEGQEILVQVTREPIGTKGARVSSHISLPGRNIVLLPTVDQIGISRKIIQEIERKRLKEIIEEIKPKSMGMIARTASEGITQDELKKEADFLVYLWEGIQKKAAKSANPSLIYEELDITLRTVRDLFKGGVETVVLDSRDEYERVITFIENFPFHFRPKIELYEGNVPIFEAYGIEEELSRALESKVWLKSGGYIVIESTEALTTIDVNTGKFVGKRHLEETILKTNLQAAKEVAYQLRLRNIGGLIIIDFIDMENESSREEVFNTLKEALKSDRMQTSILKMSELGLIQMTRKRNRDNLQSVLKEKCQYCEGTGLLKSPVTICYEIFRKIFYAKSIENTQKIEITVHPRVFDILLKDEMRQIEYLEKHTGKTISIFSTPNFHLENYEINYF